jgi:hypothetical protein
MSGYVLCMCCGYDTMSTPNADIQLCLDCDGECDPQVAIADGKLQVFQYADCPNFSASE